MRGQSLSREDPLKVDMATHSSILAWIIPWTEETGGLPSIDSQSLDTTEATWQAKRILGHSCQTLGAGGSMLPLSGTSRYCRLPPKGNPIILRPFKLQPLTPPGKGVPELS